MGASLRLMCGLLLLSALISCDSMELTIGVAPGPEGTLLVRNADQAVWNDARLVVEAEESDKSTTVCVDEMMTEWQPGEVLRVPACGDKIRFTLTVDGEIARFSYSNNQLYRRIGRKEVPIH
jgi:hypothetical protein